MLLSQNILGRLVQLMKTERNLEIRVACARTISEFCRDMARVRKRIYLFYFTFLFFISVFLTTKESAQGQQIR